jgi:hypothetical protein
MVEGDRLQTQSLVPLAVRSGYWFGEEMRRLT